MQTARSLHHHTENRRVIRPAGPAPTLTVEPVNATSAALGPQDAAEWLLEGWRAAEVAVHARRAAAQADLERRTQQRNAAEAARYARD